MATGGSGLRPEATAFVSAHDSGLGGDVTATPAATAAVAEGQDGVGRGLVSSLPLTHLSLLRTDG